MILGPPAGLALPRGKKAVRSTWMAPKSADLSERGHPLIGRSGRTDQVKMPPESVDNAPDNGQTLRHNCRGCRPVDYVKDTSLSPLREQMLD